MTRIFVRLFDRKLSKTAKVFITFGAGGIVGISMFCFKFNEIISMHKNVADITAVNQLFLVRNLFGRTRSRFTGFLLEKEIPPFLRVYAYKSFAKILKINLDEVRYPIQSYRSFAHFFARRLKDKVRPIEDVSEHSIVSPCDSEVLTLGDVELNRVEQIKNSTYNLNFFLGTEAYKKDMERKLKYIVLYLAPNSYHHFHSPCNFKIFCRRHFHGETLPVFKRFLSAFNDIFSVNERVILSGKWEDGNIHMGIVAAYNVGNIRLVDEPKFRTNNMRCQLAHLGGDIDIKVYDEKNKLNLSVGQHIGEFRLGSTIVLVFDAHPDFKWSVKAGELVKIGERLGGVKDIEKPNPPKYAFYAVDT